MMDISISGQVRTSENLFSRLFLENSGFLEFFKITHRGAPCDFFLINQILKKISKYGGKVFCCISINHTNTQGTKTAVLLTKNIFSDFFENLIRVPPVCFLEMYSKINIFPKISRKKFFQRRVPSQKCLYPSQACFCKKII